MDRDALASFRQLPAEELAERRAAVRVLILTGLGLNCEAETEAAVVIEFGRLVPRDLSFLDGGDHRAQGPLAFAVASLRGSVQVGSDLLDQHEYHCG